MLQLEVDSLRERVAEVVAQVAEKDGEILAKDGEILGLVEEREKEKSARVALEDAIFLRWSLTFAFPLAILRKKPNMFSIPGVSTR